MVEPAYVVAAAFAVLLIILLMIYGSRGTKIATVSGKFKVSGVDRTTRMDTTGYYTADSQENARVKAELDGIVVTSVEWVGEK